MALLLGLGSGMGAPACDPAQPDQPGASSVAKPAARAPRGIPPGSHDGAEASLLHEHAGRKAPSRAEIEAWQLPYQAKLLIVNLLRVAALDLIEELPALLTTDARWGLPDRREVQARAILADDGEAFLTALRGAASRLAGKSEERPEPETQSAHKPATFACPPMVPAAELLVRSGAEPMWCYYASHDKLDWLVFRLMVVEGRARIDYVGLFEQRPSTQVVIDRKDRPPPMVPPVKRPSGGVVGTPRERRQ